MHTARPYPYPAPNGSTIIVLGHENGLRILWRGGTKFTNLPRNRSTNTSQEVNGRVVVDSNDDAPSSPSHREGQDSSEFDTASDDKTSSFESIHQILDLPFGIAVLRLAFPYLPTSTESQNQSYSTKIVSEKLVAAVTCSDASVRLMTLPLIPSSMLCEKIPAGADVPTNTDGRIGSFGEQIVLVFQGSSHRGIPECVSLTFAPSFAGQDLGLEMDENKEQRATSRTSGRQQAKSTARSRSRSWGRDDGWDILVASCLSDVSGRLMIHNIGLSPHDAVGHDTRTLPQPVLLTVQHLPSPAAAIHFSPSLPHDKRNSTLLVAEKKGPVRILDCLATVDHSAFSWSVSLFPGSGFAANVGVSSDHVLDAQWVLGGKAVLALFADGGWGVWDLERSEPNPSNGTQAPQILTLGSFAAFAITGRVSNGPNTYQSTNVHLKIKDGGRVSKLTPTTPSTRRLRQENLFSGPDSHFEASPHGGLSIVRMQDTKTSDEAVSVWHKDSIIVIPSLRTHWGDKVRGSGNMFGQGAKSGARFVNTISLAGEQRSGVCLLPKGTQSIRKDCPQSDVLVLGETRFVIIAAPDSEPRSDWKVSRNAPVDRTVPGSGNQDLDGMDRILASMNNTAPTSILCANGTPTKRKVDFLDV